MLEKIKSPLKNKKGVGAFDMVYDGILFLLVTYFCIYFSLMMSYDVIKGQYNRVAQAELDAVAENRELTDAMQDHYKKDLDACTWFTGDYEIRYKVLDFKNNSFNKNDLGTSVNGQSIGHKKFNTGQIVRIEIVSSYDTLLSKFTKIIYDPGDTRVVGVAEGGVV